MRMIALLIAALATAQRRRPGERADERVDPRRNGQDARDRIRRSYDTCHSLAIQRGYSTIDQEHEGRALMNFISGCIAMGGSALTLRSSENTSKHGPFEKKRAVFFLR